MLVMLAWTWPWIPYKDLIGWGGYLGHVHQGQVWTQASPYSTQVKVNLNRVTHKFINFPVQQKLVSASPFVVIVVAYIITGHHKAF